MKDNKDSLECFKRCKEAARFTEDQIAIEVRQSKHSTPQGGHLQQNLQELNYTTVYYEAARFIGDPRRSTVLSVCVYITKKHCHCRHKASYLGP